MGLVIAFGNICGIQSLPIKVGILQKPWLALAPKVALTGFASQLVCTTALIIKIEISTHFTSETINKIVSHYNYSFPLYGNF